MNVSRLLHSIRDAFRGLSWTFRHEQNFRIQIGLAIVAIVAAELFQIRQAEFIVISLLILLVLILELVNSAVEKFLDILRPRLDVPVKIAKDIMAAAVLLASLGAMVIGAVIFWPHVIGVMQNIVIH